MNNENKLIAALLIGVLMGAVDSTIVLLALPTINSALNTTIQTSIWIIIIYLLITAVGTTQFGRVGDIIPRKYIFNAGLIIFTISSGLCGLSGSIYELIGFRGVQAVGAGLIQSNSGAIIADNFPPQRRGRVFGYTSFGYNAGAMLGIVLGGLITTFIGWRYIFYINVPIGIFATYIALRYLKKETPGKNKLDIPGAVLLASLLTFFSYGGIHITSNGFDGISKFFIVLGFVTTVIFIVVEKYVKKPLIPFRVFKIRILSLSILAAFLQSLGFLSVVFLIIMYLQGARGLSPFDSSLLLLPGYVIGSVLGPYFGKLTDRIGSKIPATSGLIMMGVAVLIYTQISLTSTLFIIIIASLVTGIGSSLFYPANNSAVMANSPKDLYGMSSGFLRTMSNIGMVSSFIISLSIASLSIPRYLAFEVFAGTVNLSKINSTVAQALINGIHSALYVSFAILMLGALMSAIRGVDARQKMNRGSSPQKIDS